MSGSRTTRQRFLRTSLRPLHLISMGLIRRIPRVVVCVCHVWRVRVYTRVKNTFKRIRVPPPPPPPDRVVVACWRVIRRMTTSEIVRVIGLMRSRSSSICLLRVSSVCFAVDRIIIIFVFPSPLMFHRRSRKVVVFSRHWRRARHTPSPSGYHEHRPAAAHLRFFFGRVGGMIVIANQRSFTIRTITTIVCMLLSGLLVGDVCVLFNNYSKHTL